MPSMNSESRRSRKKHGETFQSTIVLTDVKDLPSQLTKPAFRKLGNPAPLGLCAFALTTMVLSLINVQARGVTTPNIVIGLGISHVHPY